MNCPKCGEIGQGLRLVVHGDATRTKMWCENCGWSSEYVEALVEASPAYRKAQLEAKGAKPGWYGPDGEKATLEPFGNQAHLGSGWRLWTLQVKVLAPTQQMLFEKARLCGFVEVTR